MSVQRSANGCRCRELSVVEMHWHSRDGTAGESELASRCPRVALWAATRAQRGGRARGSEDPSASRVAGAAAAPLAEAGRALGGDPTGPRSRRRSWHHAHPPPSSPPARLAILSRRRRHRTQCEALTCAVFTLNLDPELAQVAPERAATDAAASATGGTPLPLGDAPHEAIPIFGGIPATPRQRRPGPRGLCAVGPLASNRADCRCSSAPTMKASRRRICRHRRTYECAMRQRPDWSWRICRH